MAITDLLSAAQGGSYFANVAAACGLDVATTTQAIGKFAPAIAAKLKDKAAADPDVFGNLLDLLDDGDGSDLNDVVAITGEEAIADGTEILDDLYGTTAQFNLAKLAPTLKTADVTKLGAITATSVLSALSVQNAALLSNGAASATGSRGGGLWSIIISALLKGLLQGAQRQLAPRRRRRYKTYTGRRTATRRRKRSVGLEDIFKDILGGRRRATRRCEHGYFRNRPAIWFR